MNLNKHYCQTLNIAIFYWTVTHSLLSAYKILLNFTIKILQIGSFEIVQTVSNTVTKSGHNGRINISLGKNKPRGLSWGSPYHHHLSSKPLTDTQQNPALSYLLWFSENREFNNKLKLPPGVCMHFNFCQSSPHPLHLHISGIPCVSTVGMGKMKQREQSH